MTLINEVLKAQEESYEKWFERWFDKQNLEKKLKESAMQGYTKFTYSLGNNRDKYENRRMTNEKFVELLQDKLPGFKVYKTESEQFERTLLGRHLGYGWTDPKITISWPEIYER